MVIDSIINYAQNIIDTINSFSPGYKTLAILSVYTLIIVIYSVFIWRFYKFLSSRDILTLNLKQYNYSEHPFFEKLFAVLLYILEYLIILPFLVLFWLGILSLSLLLLSTRIPWQVLLISAAIITSIRITSYLSEELSIDLAKTMPLVVLATFVLEAEFFNIENFITKLSEIPLLFNDIFIFIIFIFFVEFLMRMLYLFKELKSS